jgi:hypothetical protein
VINMRLTSIVLALILSACVHGQMSTRSTADTRPSAVRVDPYFRLPSTRENALHILETTDRFADIAIGEGGSPSPEVCAFVILIKEPDAMQLFRALMDRAGLAGQLYALSGFYLLNRDLYASEVVRYESNSTVVDSAMGCIVSSMKVSEILHAPDEHGLDIAGGGYPKRFAEFEGCPK